MEANPNKSQTHTTQLTPHSVLVFGINCFQVQFLSPSPRLCDGEVVETDLNFFFLLACKTMNQNVSCETIIVSLGKCEFFILWEIFH